MKIRGSPVDTIQLSKTTVQQFPFLTGPLTSVNLSPSVKLG
jgi:hypothetical protein